jgi:hypothetical protein
MKAMSVEERRAARKLRRNRNRMSLAAQRRSARKRRRERKQLNDAMRGMVTSFHEAMTEISRFALAYLEKSNHSPWSRGGMDS